MLCPKCGSHDKVNRDGKNSNGKQIWRHLKCPANGFSDFTFTENTELYKNENTDFDYNWEEDSKGQANVNANNFKSDSSDRDKILNEFLQECGIDKKKWDIDKVKISRWGVSSKWRDQDLKWDNNGMMTGHATRKNEWVKTKNYSISITLSRNKNEDLIKGFENYINKIPKFQYTNKIPKVKHESGHALEIAPLDAHFGKLSWIDETGYRQYDLNIANEDFSYAINEMLQWSSPFNIEKIYYIIGQDLFHVDNMENETQASGHALDVDGRMPKIYENVFTTVTKTIYKARAMAPVEIIWIPGNHDYLASMFLTYSLYEHFKNDKYIEVDIWNASSKRSRKARLWGNLLVGWTHRISKSGQTTWGNELAQAFPEEWGKSVFREWHHGHIHKKQTVKTTPEFTSGGVLCRQLTALTPVDKWHFENVFTDAVPGGEAFIWTMDKGIKSNIISWTSQYDNYRDKIVK